MLVMFSVSIILMSAPVMAQENEIENELGNPGITPDSSFYFLDRMFDWLQTAESRANEKAAEVLAMAREGKVEHAQIALRHYESAMEKRQEQSQGNEDVAEEVAMQATNHLILLAGVLEQVPEEAKPAIQRAMEVSTRGRDESISALTEINPSRGERVARETLQKVIDETPTQSQEGLTRAFNSIDSKEYVEAREETEITTSGGTTSGTTSGGTTSGTTTGSGSTGGSTGGSSGATTSSGGSSDGTATSSSGPAAVNLGTSGDFAILSKAGVSTTGTTSITGDIGVSPIDSTAITGFGLIVDSSECFSTSSLVTGNIYAADYDTLGCPTPAKMTTAVSDMETAYADAAGRVNPTATELGSGDISGLTITPGLYKWGTGVLINNGVTLSCQNSDDTFIFQIAKDLTVGNGAIVTLSGGCQAKNIFWQVNGQATLGTTSDFKGNILSATLIEMNTGATLNGRALTQTAVTLDSNAVTKSD